jgi:predicted component of type VI protein secretion system
MPFLLERLALPPLLSDEYTFDIRTAIAAQIQRLVNVRTITFDSDLNLLEISCENVVDISLNNKAQLENYARKLTRLILRYEPRLLAPSVSIQSMHDSLNPYQLVVKGSLSPDTAAEVFYFELPLH